MVCFGGWFSLLGGLGFQLMLWGGNLCLICTGPARNFWRQVSGTLFYMCGPSMPSFSILAIYMERSQKTGKGKAPSSSMERAVKKRKSDSSQPIKKGKGKQIDSSSESEKVSENDDDEIEAMFAEGSESEQEKWAQSIANRGFHCERGVKLETFLYSHPIRGVIQEQNFQFVCTDVQGYLPTLVRKFYTNLRENQRVETLLETTVMGK